jgi:Xaa-Pro aminopeptidase
MDDAPYAARRRRVLDLLGADGALVLAATPELLVGADTELRYVVDADLYYLTGYTEPEAVLVLCPSSDEAPFTLFVRSRDASRELWTGRRGGVESARERFAADAAHPIAELGEKLPKIVAGANRLYARLRGGRPEIDAALLDVLVNARHTRPRTGRGPHTIVDHGVVLDDMRLLKDAHEIARLRSAAAVSIEAFREAAPFVRAGSGEWLVEAALEAGFRARRASGPAFPSIVAAGANATVLHYIDNNCTLAHGQLLLIDAGARKDMYCADITRTFPVGGRFTTEQRELYESVLRAHDAAIDAVRPGATIDDVHGAALRVLVDALPALRLIDGTAEEALADEQRYRRFIPHRTSHWLGLDVHDVGAYRVGGESRRLEPGMVLTIEPGLYVGIDVDHPLAGTGVRIEDDVLVTAEGHDVLTAALPAAADEVAALASPA